MLLAGHYVKRFGKRKMMLFAVASGAIFYLGLVVFHDKAALMALQMFNAIFIGIVAGIGMLYFQDLMPGRPGAATTLFHQQYFNRGDSGGRDSGRAGGNLWPLFGVLGGVSIVDWALVMSAKVKDV